VPGLLEEKGSDYFYFAHKSYWEFLVAEYLLKARLTDRQIDQISTKITKQLLDFLYSAQSELTTNLYNRISVTPARASIHLYELAARSPVAGLMFESDDIKISANQLVIYCIVARESRKQISNQNWEEFFFRVENEGSENFCGMVFGLLYWASTDEEIRSRIIAAVCAVCAVAVSRWISKLDRKEDRREQYSEIGLEKEHGIRAFLSAIEIVNREGVQINCDLLLRNLADLQLVNVEGTTLESAMGSETVPMEAFERLRDSADGLDFLRLLSRAHRDYLERTEREIDDALEMPDED
jgi:hypothetical protein